MQPNQQVGTTTTTATSSSSNNNNNNNNKIKYKGVRRRRWGKWVSEIRVPGTQERLWLGSYSNPEAAAVAHDTAVFFLHGPVGGFNFPDRIGRFVWASLSPHSVQKAASESGMAADAELEIQKGAMERDEKDEKEIEEREDVAFDDMGIYM